MNGFTYEKLVDGEFIFNPEFGQLNYIDGNIIFEPMSIPEGIVFTPDSLSLFIEAASKMLKDMEGRI